MRRSIEFLAIMSSHSIAQFHEKVAASPELQMRLRSIASPVELIALAQEYGCELDGNDLQEIAQQAYQQWVTQLADASRSFFEAAQANAAINQTLKQCRTPAEVIALAKEFGFDLTIADLAQAATIAETVPGFSFEKLWFRGLGLLQ